MKMEVFPIISLLKPLRTWIDNYLYMKSFAPIDYKSLRMESLNENILISAEGLLNVLRR